MRLRSKASAMGLNRVRLGELIKRSDARNADEKYCVDHVRGMSVEKVFIPTKADMRGVSLKPYKLVEPDWFAYVTITSRNSDKITLARNTSKDTYIVSSSYEVFFVSDSKRLDSNYLFMFFNRAEFDRYARFNSWGSAREAFSWEDFCDIEIELPPIEVQRKYAAVYEAMLANQRFYEQGLDDLKTICFSTIERFRREMPLKPIGNYVRTYNEKNSDGAITLEQGVNIQKQFITPQRPNSNLLGRKIVRHGQFAYCTQLNNANVAIAIREGCDCVVSSVYDVFEITKTDELLADYLMLWLIRPEFGRYVYWASVGSAYEFLSFENLANYKIPVPTIAEQKSVADIYQVYKKRYAINERLKSQLKDICPILIRGSIEEASR